jgi:hypothetical protein
MTEEDCSESLNTAGTVLTLCRRPADAWTVPGQPTSLFFVLGMYYDQPSGNLYIADDPMAGKRFGSGHEWVVNAAKVP